MESKEVCVTKEYCVRWYGIYKSDYQLAKSDDGRFVALRSMKRIMDIAASAYGFDFADALQK